MSPLHKLGNFARKIGGGVTAVKTAADAYDQARTAFGSIRGNASNEGMNNNQSPYRHPVYEDDEPEEDNRYSNNGYSEIEISDSVARNFRKKAEMKADLMIIRVKKSYLWKRIAAKLIVSNKGDDDIYLTHKYDTFDELALLPKEIQKVVRNQRHVEKIESVTIDEILKESCIEYFILEFEEDYRNGIAPDFSGINPVELILQKFNEPFNELFGDLILDFGLENKQKAVAFGKILLAKMKDKANIQEAETIIADEIEKAYPDVEEDLPENEFIEEIEDTAGNMQQYEYEDDSENPLNDEPE